MFFRKLPSRLIDNWKREMVLFQHRCKISLTENISRRWSFILVKVTA